MKTEKDFFERTASNIVDAIVEDLSDRNGIKQAWYDIDEEIQDEIRQTWKEIVIKHISEK